MGVAGVSRAQQQRDLGQAVDIRVEHHRDLAESWDRDAPEWTVTAVAADLDAIDTTPPAPVCRVELVKVPLGRPDQAELMALHAQHLDWVGQDLLDDAGDLREDLLDPIALIGGNAILVITDVGVEPAYAGLDIDRLIALEAISLLGGGCDLAVALTLAHPPALGAPVTTLDVNRARRSWREIGFQSITDQVMVLYLATTTLEHHLHRLRTTFGLAP